MCECGGVGGKACDIEYGYCHCRCGGKTNLATRNDKRRGWVKGEPLKFIHGHQSRVPLESRFWKYVDKSPGQGPKGECWEWTGNRKEHGYGQIEIDGKAFRAHRVAWQFKHGPIPPDKEILHTCDNPPCCRDEHLFIGTQQDNIDDMWAKGRGSAKLTAERVARIRRDGAPYVRHPGKRGTAKLLRDIARREGVSVSNVRMILNNVVWKKGSRDGKH